MLQLLLVTAPLSAVCSRLPHGIPLSADSRHSERLASQANFATFDRRRRGGGDLRASLTEHRVVDDRVGTFLAFWNTQRRGRRWRCRSCENLKGAAKFMVRLAGVEPAALGLEVEAPQTGGGPTFGQGVALAPFPLESLLVPSPGGEARRAYPDLLGRLTASAPCSSVRRIRSSRLARERSACRPRDAEPPS
jgi:hypothetical protein